MPPNQPITLFAARFGLRERLLLLVGGKTPARTPGDRRAECRLVIFDYKEVIAASLCNLLANLALAEHGVAGDNSAFQHQRGSSSKAALASLV